MEMGILEWVLDNRNNAVRSCMYIYACHYEKDKPVDFTFLLPLRFPVPFCSRFRERQEGKSRSREVGC